MKAWDWSERFLSQNSSQGVGTECVYDNPWSGRREYWRDGLCLAWIDIMALDRADLWFFYYGGEGEWFGPFRAGQVKGSAWALVDKLGQAWM